MLRPMFSVLFSILCAVGGCSTNDTGSEPDPNTPAANGGFEGDLAGGNSGAEGAIAPCEQAREDLGSLDEVSEVLEFSANDLLDAIGRTHTVLMRWERQDSQPRLEPGDDELTLALEPSSESAAAYHCDDPDYPEELLADQPPHMEVPVTLALQTAGGQLDEQFETLLVAKDLGLATVAVEVEPEEVNGSLGALVTDFYTGTRRQIRVEVTFTRDGPVGVIMGPHSPHASDPCLFNLYARWPHDVQCWEQEWVAAPEAAPTMSAYAQELSRTYALEWADGVSTSATVEITPREASICRTGAIGLSARADIAISTDDGRLEATLSGWLGGGPSAYDGEPDEMDAYGLMALTNEELADHFDYDGDADAGILELYLHFSTAAVDEPPFAGSFQVSLLDRTGFENVLPPMNEFFSPRCFDAAGRWFPPLLLEGDLSAGEPNPPIPGMGMAQ